MKSKTFLTIIVVFFYVIIIGLVAKNLKEDLRCFKQNSGCFRFCSDDTEEYSDDILFQEFNKSKSLQGLTIKNVKVYRGYTLCGGTEFFHPNNNITSENRPYDFYRVCLLLIS